jgi:hypothetical protein
MRPGTPSRTELRLGGSALGIGLAAVGLLRLSHHAASAFALLAAALLVLALSAFAPAVFRPVVGVGRAIGRPAVWLATRVALLLVFYVVVTPIAVVGRLLGAHFSDADFSKRRESYWKQRDGQMKRAGEYERQY